MKKTIRIIDELLPLAFNTGKKRVLVIFGLIVSVVCLTVYEKHDMQKTNQVSTSSKTQASYAHITDLKINEK
jgi:hypothetical protein